MTVRSADYCKQLIADLERAGYSVYKIAQVMTQAGTKTHHTQVKRWADGSEPRVSQARLIEDLHAQLVR